MQISEHLFPHLLADHDARLEADLERRRAVLERLAEEHPAPASDANRSGFGRRARRSARAIPRPA